MRPDVAKSLPCWLSQFSFSKPRQPTEQRLSNVRMQQIKISIRPFSFLYYEESLVSSNLNSKQLSSHCAHPNIHICICIQFNFERNIFGPIVSFSPLRSLYLVGFHTKPLWFYTRNHLSCRLYVIFILNTTGNLSNFLATEL